MTLLPFDREIGEHQRLSGVVIPVVSRRGLISPDLLTVLGAERDDGSDGEIVALTAQPVIPRRSIPSAEEDEVQVLIVHNGVPRASATSGFPPLARPRCCRSSH